MRVVICACVISNVIGARMHIIDVVRVYKGVIIRAFIDLVCYHMGIKVMS